MSKFVKKYITLITIASFLAGCATAGKDVAATYVSPIQYSNYDCDQLRQELARINGRVSQVTGRLDEAASNDKALVGVGMILFWPALFALGGTKQQEAELSRMKGEYEAIQTALISKKCGT
jgi:outer membrane lipoprotein-sorting protein